MLVINPGIIPPSTIAIIAPSPAPALIPIRPGSARGFRNSPCITAPEIAKAAPTQVPNSKRGRRISKMIIYSSDVRSSFSINFFKINQIDTSAGPIARLKQPTKSRAKVRMTWARLPTRYLSANIDLFLLSSVAHIN